MIGQYFHALNLLVTKLHFLCADMTGPLTFDSAHSATSQLLPTRGSRGEPNSAANYLLLLVKWGSLRVVVVWFVRMGGGVQYPPRIGCKRDIGIELCT